jgi:hypothetical protein
MEESALDRIPFKATGLIPKILCRRFVDRKPHASSPAGFVAENRDFRPARHGSFCRPRQNVPLIPAPRLPGGFTKKAEFAGLAKVVRPLLLTHRNFRGPPAWSMWQQ